MGKVCVRAQPIRRVRALALGNSIVTIYIAPWSSCGDMRWTSIHDSPEGDPSTFPHVHLFVRLHACSESFTCIR